ncbi:MAG: carbonic anhydrase [Planctomycetia bacterium]|nr:carbonic anhydrase [Planctomycetia bacterium]
MQKLVQGIHHFQNSVFRQQRLQRLTEGQQPLALMITCSDSRICPSLMTQTEPGDLFILRNAGNLVPAFSVSSGGEAATIEYAVSALKVADIIICGHSHCGAMQALLDPKSLDKLPSVKSWLTHAEATRRIIEENYGHLTDKDSRLMVTVEENVLVQLEHLRTHPSVAAAMGRGDLKLSGWVYNLNTGSVFAYDATQGQFGPIADTDARLSPAPQMLQRSAG